MSEEPETIRYAYFKAKATVNLRDRWVTVKTPDLWLITTAAPYVFESPPLYNVYSDSLSNSTPMRDAVVSLMHIGVSPVLLIAGDAFTVLGEPPDDSIELLTQPAIFIKDGMECRVEKTIPCKFDFRNIEYAGRVISSLEMLRLAAELEIDGFA